jgi:PAS domain S-box-containing protein
MYFSVSFFFSKKATMQQAAAYLLYHHFLSGGRKTLRRSAKKPASLSVQEAGGMRSLYAGFYFITILRKLGYNTGVNGKKTAAVIKKILVLLLFVFVFSILARGEGHAQITHKKKVLVINSYHKGLSWTDNIVAGIESVLQAEGKGKNIDFFIEYMDTKRYYGERYFQTLYASFVEKYANKRFDVVIVTDNDAFNFVRKHYRALFHTTPIVFCGINDYQDSMLAGYHRFTGVVEDTDLASTIEIVLKLHPHTAQIVLVNDKTTTGIAMKNEALKVIPSFQDKVKFVFLDDFDFSELQMKIRALPSDSVILVTVVNRDRTGNFFAYEESIEFIRAASKVPIYSIWEFYLGRGIVGGMLTSGFQQGKSAAGIARRILQGEDVSTIPVIKTSPNAYMFDYRELSRFNIGLSALPAESIVINKPDSFYAQYKDTILVAVGIIFALSVIIIALLINISIRHRYEKALEESEKKYRDLYDNAPDMYHSINRDGIIMDCNETEARMLGYRKEEIIGRSIGDFQTEASQERYIREFSSLPTHKQMFGLEREFIRKDGSTFIVSQNVFVEVDEKGELIRTKTIGRDMTERNRVEAALRRSREELRNLSAHIQSALEEERGHIAREIHDELGQTLSKLKLDIAWMKKRMTKDQKQLVEKADRMSGLVDSTIQSVQRISSKLRPGVLDYLGLPAAIEWQAKEFREQTGIRCITKIATDVQVEDQNITIAIFRIFQETLTNIIRHAKANRVNVVLKHEDDAIVLSVKDNGIGIPVDKLSNRSSFGLMGIKERARFHNGKVEIESAPAKGTSIRVSIPLDGRVNI